MPRLFTGLEIPEDVAFELNLLQGGVYGARWVERSDYHITLRFIGDIEERLAGEIRTSLETVEAQPFTIRIKGIGAFGGNDPHTIFAGVAESSEVRRLQSALERQCQMLGLSPEGRKFTPHVTLARLKSPSLSNVQEFLARQNLFVSRPFEIQRFVLYSSRPSRGGGPYAVIESYDLRRVAV
ncbi:MAG TPA: RNA 2',3'-cyclic phosphodiesterase [Aestuariivirgaceae bacterium]|jgi:2'-5' RNA ligase